MRCDIHGEKCKWLAFCNVCLENKNLFFHEHFTPPAFVAQGIEQVVSTHRVAGSNPAEGT